MSTVGIILIFIIILLIAVIGIVLNWIFLSPGNSQLQALSNHQSLAGVGGQVDAKVGTRQSFGVSEEVEDNKPKVLDDKNKNVIYFQAGFFSPEEINSFNFKYKIVLVVLALGLGIGLSLYFNLLYGGIGAVFGILVGRIAPDRAISKRVKSRQEECSYYLPLIIEELAIGVSSGLDIGPCIAYIVDMAQERRANNVVTELFGHVMKLTKAGMSLEEALLEIGAISGYAPVRNTFNFLAQCSRHGGEVSKQLLELSDAVTSERQSAIETMINGLGNKATLSLGLVFGGFFIILMSGIAMRMLEAFKTN